MPPLPSKRFPFRLAGLAPILGLVAALLSGCSSAPKGGTYDFYIEGQGRRQIEAISLRGFEAHSTGSPICVWDVKVAGLGGRGLIYPDSVTTSSLAFEKQRGLYPPDADALENKTCTVPWTRRLGSKQDLPKGKFEAIRGGGQPFPAYYLPHMRIEFRRAKDGPLEVWEARIPIEQYRQSKRELYDPVFVIDESGVRMTARLFADAGATRIPIEIPASRVSQNPQ